jgi:signal peptidase I
LLDNNNLVFDQKLATIGVFHFVANIDGLKKVKTDSMLYKVKRIIDHPSVSFNGNNAISPALYWNKDNMGPLFVPGKGSKLKITEKVYYIYKQIIEKESGKQLELINHKVYLSKTPLYLYTFKQNYYFLLNDNRQDIDDSRTIGLISEDQILSKFWFKLPW